MKTIVVLDDEPYVTQFLRKVLEGAGYRVIRTHCSKDAEAVLANSEDRPDLFITDLIAPEGNRMDLVAALRKEERGLKDLPVIVFTGLAGDYRRRDDDLGDVYLTKPSSARDIRMTVQKLLAN